jgi:hypothetical protein
LGKSISLLILLVLVGSAILMVLPVEANPYMYHESVPAPSYVKPPKIVIASPSENEIYPADTPITLSFNVTGPDAANLLTKYLSVVDYTGDWIQNAEHAYRTKNFETYTPDDFPFFLEFTFSITGIPSGKHSVVITAIGGGGYAEGLTWYSFSANNSSTINFIVGTSTVPEFPSWITTAPFIVVTLLIVIIYVKIPKFEWESR